MGIVESKCLLLWLLIFSYSETAKSVISHNTEFPCSMVYGEISNTAVLPSGDDKDKLTYTSSQAEPR